MRKINLIKRKKIKVLPKKPPTTTGGPTNRPRKAKYPPAQAQESFVYVIATTRNERTYYVKNIQQDTGAVMWTPSQDNAMMFHTENGTQHFVHAYLKNRDNVWPMELRSPYQ